MFHIHGVLPPNARQASDLVITDQDFGDFYLRRRVVPDFVYDAARLYHLVLVGYSANDPPMRYLLNAVAADGFHFSDIKERFVFVGQQPQIRSNLLSGGRVALRLSLTIVRTTTSNSAGASKNGPASRPSGAEVGQPSARCAGSRSSTSPPRRKPNTICLHTSFVAPMLMSAPGLHAWRRP